MAADGRAVVLAAATPVRIRALVERPLPDVVLEWRFDELERAGVDAVEAVKFALDPTFDLGAFRDLVTRGCNAALAARIVR